MHAHLSVLTLAVHDLQAALYFYCQGLGLKSEGILDKTMKMVPLPLLNCNLD